MYQHFVVDTIFDAAIVFSLYRLFVFFFSIFLFLSLSLSPALDSLTAKIAMNLSFFWMELNRMCQHELLVAGGAKHYPGPYDSFPG